MISRRGATLIYAIGLVAAAVPWYMHGANGLAFIVSLCALGLLLELPHAKVPEAALCLFMLGLLVVDAVRSPFGGTEIVLGNVRLEDWLYALPIWCAAGCMLRAALYDEEGKD